MGITDNGETNSVDKIYSRAEDKLTRDGETSSDDKNYRLHCKEPMPTIQNKYSQKRKCAVDCPNFHIHVPVRDLYIPTIDLPILLQDNIWTDPKNI